MNDIQNLLGSAPATEKPKDEEPKAPSKSKKELDEKSIIEMMMTGENSTGTFVPDTEDIVDEKDKDKVHEDTKENLDIKTGKTTTVSKKYQNAMVEDMIKHPDKFTVDTPEGEMTVKEAMSRGYNPVTKKFDGDKYKSDKENALAQLNDNDRASLDKLTNMNGIGLAPADGSAMGLNPDNPAIKQAPQLPPENVQAPPAQGQQPDIASLLGGKGGLV